jgi:hypothetical protein
MMYGLIVRWSLQQVGDEVAQQLRDYVAQTSLARFTAMPGLSFKVWRMHEGQWFEGTYVFATEAARDDFAAAFAAQAPTAPGTMMIGSEPITLEACEIVAVAEGGSGFAAGVGPGSRG